MVSPRDLLPSIPNVNLCIQTLSALETLNSIPIGRITQFTRTFLDDIRQTILSGKDPGPLTLDDNGILPELAAFILKRHEPKLKQIINATGVIVHTNLGRSLLPKEAMHSIIAAGTHYSNLELDVDTGKRGSRYSLVEELICDLTGAEAALVVNNNAAAVLLVLQTLAQGKEAIVSRGQLVEIGGSFRIPDVMERSGARLVEVGATNRTHLKDYRNAIGEKTGVLLRVHCSNYRIIGFTSEVSNKELVALGNECDIPVVEDLGSGCFIDLSRFGLEKEPTVQEVVQSGVDVVTFSGDKLLGGPQAGIIAGKLKHIEAIKRNPLNRALRIDKFTLAGLESILRCYLDPSTVVEKIPTLKMIADPVEVVEEKVSQCKAALDPICAEKFCLKIVDVFSRVGGGAMPEQNLPSKALAFEPDGCAVSTFEKLLRRQRVPLIARVEGDRLLMDLRTVEDDEVKLIVENVTSAMKQLRVR